MVIPAAAPTSTQQHLIWVYVAKVADAIEDMTIMMVMLLVGFVPGQVIFDYGCTHFFISFAHTRRIDDKIEEL